VINLIKLVLIYQTPLNIFERRLNADDIVYYRSTSAACSFSSDRLRSSVVHERLFKNKSDADRKSNNFRFDRRQYIYIYSVRIQTEIPVSRSEIEFTDDMGRKLKITDNPP